jgi:hypothetical protein
MSSVVGWKGLGRATTKGRCKALGRLPMLDLAVQMVSLIKTDAKKWLTTV